MKITKHQTYFNVAQNMSYLEDNSIDLIVTSPPYPMIEMWDEIMGNQNIKIKDSINKLEGNLAFELMHEELDKVWNECYRVLKDGGIACINIGDATRTFNDNFALYSNHSRIISQCINIGFTNITNIIWRKQTNAPNKFMGSGMLPCGAYVTLEHEWILIFRKGGKRIFKTEEDKDLRRQSSYFWEERNLWFSDIWDLKGTKQKLKDNSSRERSAAFPLSIPYRLINMYSVKGDTVLDPFMGTGTTAIAAILSERNSIGYEIDSSFGPIINDNIMNVNIDALNSFIRNRIISHKDFISERMKNKEIKHFNEKLNLPVVTSQETGIEFSYINSIKNNESVIKASYTSILRDFDLPFKEEGTLFQNAFTK